MKFKLLIAFCLFLSLEARAQQTDPAQPDPPRSLAGNGSVNGPVSGDPQPVPQVNQSAQDQASTEGEEPASVFPHLIADRFWISGQANFIFQASGPFHAPYSGANSFRAGGDTAFSRVLTLYTGVKLLRFTEFLFDAEETGGSGLSDALGIAGFTNLDVVRNPTLSQNVYMARVMLHHTIPLSADRVELDPNPFFLQSSIPRRRLEFRIGKMSIPDFFDVNAIGSDSHLQFTNWAIDNNAAYDYAADTRGYTYAAVVEYQGPAFGVRFGEALMPTVANGITLDWALRRARAENLELEYRPRWFQGLPTHIRPLAYLNHANMGSYREAVNAYLAGVDKTPDITLHRHQGTLKQGFGLNIEQELPADFRVYFRTGWNEGKHESFAYTEVNNTFALGVDLTGGAWGRKNDKLGTAIVTNGLSQDHRDYLARGGLGFILGDGRLNYGREFISETYYNARLWRGLNLSAQLSFIQNPGYNRDRGPIVVPGLRGHIDF